MANVNIRAATRDGGATEFGYLLEVGDFVKLAKSAKCPDKAGMLEANAPTNEDGMVTYESLFRYCKENGQINPDDVPSGASFKAQDWQDFQAWWRMRIIFMSADKDMSGSLSMSEVRPHRFHHFPNEQPGMQWPGANCCCWLVTGGGTPSAAPKPDQVGMERHAARLARGRGKSAHSDRQQNSMRKSSTRLWRSTCGGCGPVQALEEFQAWWNMRRKFDQVDTDQSEQLEKDEMIKMSELLRIPNFEVADMDLAAEGKISFNDFQAWWRMRMMFTKADESGEDHLTRGEVQKLARDLGIQISVRSMDVDGDDCIDFSEFAVWWNMRHKFDMADTNNSGSLDMDEANALGKSLGAEVNFEDMDEDGDNSVDFKEFTEWYKMRRCFEKIDVDGGGTLDHDEIKRLAYMLNMDLRIEDIDNDGSGEVDFQEFQQWWGGNKTRAQVMSRVAMQMDRDAANKVEQEPGPPAALYIGFAATFTVLSVVPTVVSVLGQIATLKDEARLAGYTE